LSRSSASSRRARFSSAAAPRAALSARASLVRARDSSLASWLARSLRKFYSVIGLNGEIERIILVSFPGNKQTNKQTNKQKNREKQKKKQE
jgi:hypothetical protein